jgi:hypothetical protein
VLRYNECESDLEHMFNDIIGGGSNGSHKGAPGARLRRLRQRRSATAGTTASEIEGGNRNTRVWGNYITQTMMGDRERGDVEIGPLYIWKNVYARSQWQPDSTGGNFIKMGYAGSEDWMTGTCTCSTITMFRVDDGRPTGGLGGSRLVKHVVSRNNILHVRGPGTSA